MPLKLNEKTWTGNKKFISRSETIISIYRKFFGNSIPKDKQYWSICGQQNKDDKSEISQMINDKLIEEKQFYGVDIDKGIIEFNKKEYPNANWYCNDFYRQLTLVKDLNPAIVNCDFISYPDRAIQYYSDVLNLLSEHKDLIVIGNMVTSHQRFSYRDRDIDFIMEKLNKCHAFQCAIYKADWKLYPEYYTYKGADEKSRTTMSTIVLYK
jgi:hypothetical protein